jgi:Spy/CpxP family protein refolding chaperone
MALGLAAGMVYAQAPAGIPAQRRHHTQARRHNHWKLMTGYLGLTGGQQEQAKAIFESARASAKPVREQLRQVRSEMRTAIQEGKPVTKIAGNEGNLVGQLAAIRANSAERFRALLTPQQLQKLQQLRSQRS